MKKFILLAFVLLLFCSCAYADVKYNGTNFDSFAEAVEEAKRVDDEEGKTADTEPVFTISGTHVFDEEDPVTFDSTFSNVTVEGGTIRASSAIRFFKVSTTVIFNNVTFDGSSIGGGVEINSGGNATFSNCTFNSNKTTGNGGAVYNSGGTVTFEGGTFSSNSAANGGAIATNAGVTFNGTGTFTSNTATENGGAIYVNSGVTFSFAGAPIFTSNTAATNGGAIFSAGTLSMAGGTFNTNTSGGSGGAVYNSGTLTFSAEPTFNKNISEGSGGAVYSTSDLTFAGGTFSDNKSSSGSGGALYISGGNSTFNGGAEFSSNSAAINGGGIYIGGATTFSAGSNTTFILKSNSAGTMGSTEEYAYTNGLGGAIYSGSSSTVSFGSLSIDGESAYIGNWGAFYISTGSVNINGTLNVTNNMTSCGGGLYITTGNLMVSNTATFTNNRARDHGGAVYVMSTGVVTFNSGATFTNNIANSDSLSAGDGGAIWAGTSESFKTSGNMVFTQNQTEGGSGSSNINYADGGAIFIAGGSPAFKITSSYSFTDNVSYGAGGAVYVIGEVQITNYELSNKNSSENGDGGFVYASGNVNISGSTISNQESGISGGVVFSEGNVTINNSNFNKNVAEESGGAIYAEGYITVDNSTFGNAEGNTAEANGGAIYSEKYIRISLSQFNDNEAGESGGAVYAVGTLTITNSSFGAFGKNMANSGSGGAVFSSSDVTIGGNSEFLYNEVTCESGTANAKEGGGAVFCGGALTLTDSTFRQNHSIGRTSTQGGGAVMVWGSGSTITNCTFVSNDHDSSGQANNGGGAVFSTGSLTVTGSTFGENKAKNNSAIGGAIVAHGSALTLENCYLYENSAYRNGGGVYANSGITTNQTTFRDNQTTNGAGGAIFAMSNLESSLSYYLSNRANTDGGAIYFNNYNSSTLVTVTTSMFVYNKANGGSGGAIYTWCDKADINRSTFDNNQAQNSGKDTKGGAGYIRVESSSSIENCTFVRNEVYGGENNYGGALTLYGGITMRSCTVALENTASPGRGGGVYVESDTLTLVASIIVGNKATLGADIHVSSSASASSSGYNRIGVNGNADANSPMMTNWGNSDAGDKENADWVTSDFFGENNIAANNPGSGYGSTPTVGSSLYDTVPLKTLAIDDDDLDTEYRILDAIRGNRTGFAAETDERGVSRPIPSYNPSKNIYYGYDIGAIEMIQDGYRSDSTEEGYTIASVTISGVPNTLMTVGQTTSLVAMVKYSNGRTATEEDINDPVTWSSSNTAAVTVDQSGNITAVGYGFAKIEIVSQRDAAKTDSVMIMVSDADIYTNIDPEIANRLGVFVESVSDQYNTYFSFAGGATDEDMESVKSSFANLWSETPALVENIDDNDCKFTSRNSGYSTAGFSFVKPAYQLDIYNCDTGNLIPMLYQWQFTGDEIKKLIGHDLSAVSINSKTTVDEIFSALRPDFQGANNKSLVILGDGGESISEAISDKILKLSKCDSNKGVQIDLTVYIANVGTSTTSGAYSASVSSNNKAVILSGAGSNKLLVVPDGSDDGKISGAVWMVGRASDSGSGSSGGGGGGCNVFSSSLIILLAGFIFRRKY